MLVVILSLVNAFVEPNEFVVGFLSLVSNLAESISDGSNSAHAKFLGA
jgi:hypothetical protein